MAARLIHAPWVLPVASPLIRDGAVAVDVDGAILAVGPRDEVRARFAGLPDERADGVLMPGLVNAHAHLELAALRGQVPGGDGFIPWAMTLGRVVPEVSAEVRYRAALAAAQQMVACGTSAVGDVANALDHVSLIGEVGLRGLVFHELLGSRELRTGDALADAERERQEFIARSPWPPGVGYVPTPHALFSAGPYLLRRIFAAAAQSPHPTTVHLAEDPDEIALLRDGSGRWSAVLQAMGVPENSRTPHMDPLEYLAALGGFDAPRPPILVHMVHASAHDRALAKQHNATVVLCPRSNLHIGGRLADVPALLKDGLRLALGTDGLASAPDASLWGEIASLAVAFPDVDPTVWLAAATRGGARALALESLGTLAVGKRPGVIAVTPHPASNGNADPLRELVRDQSPVIRWLVRP